jgi:hypothetical protein
VALNDFLAPVMDLLPEKRWRRITPQAVHGILAQQMRVIAAMAQSTPRQETSCWTGAKRFYRFVWNRGFNHHQFFKRMRRLFALVLLSAQFIFFQIKHWPPRAVV